MNNNKILAILNYLKSFAAEHRKYLITIILIAPFIALYFLKNETPKFIVEAVLIEESQTNVSLDNPIASIIGAAQSSSNFNFFFWKMQSSEVAMRLWDKGYDDVFFSTNFNTNTNSYIREIPFFERFINSIMGIQGNNELGHKDLKRIISSKIKFEIDKAAPNIYSLKIETTKPARDLKLLEDLIFETDQIIRNNKQSILVSKRQFFEDQANLIQDKNTKAALYGLMQQNLLDESLLNDENYLLFFQIIEAPFISDGPTFVSPLFVLLSIIFIFIGLDFIIYFIRRNFV